MAASRDSRDHHRGDTSSGGTAQGRQWGVTKITRELFKLNLTNLSILWHFLSQAIRFTKNKLNILSWHVHLFTPECLPRVDWPSPVPGIQPRPAGVSWWWWPWWWWWWPWWPWGPQCPGQEPESAQPLPPDPQTLQDAPTAEHDRKVSRLCVEWEYWTVMTQEGRLIIFLLIRNSNRKDLILKRLFDQVWSRVSKKKIFVLYVRWQEKFEMLLFLNV